MALQLISPPEIEPISLEEAKLHLKVETDDDDELISGLIRAAREYCETFQNRAYITQTWQLWLDAFPEVPYIEIPKPPLQAVDSVMYYDRDGEAHEFSGYLVDTKSQPGRVVLKAGCYWPSLALQLSNGVCITFTAGYGDDAESVPQRIKQAILLVVGSWYEIRENYISSGFIPREVPLGAERLLWQDRILQ